MLKTDRILALDIGTSGIKLAEFAPGKTGAIELQNFAVSSLGLIPGEDDDRSLYITSTIKEMMSERNIKPGPVVVSVSGQAVFSRFVKLPPVEQDKVGQIVAYEAQQNVPFPIEEVVWDYQLIGTGDEEMDVMLVAIKGEIIEALTDAVEQAGLRTELVDVSPMALYNAARFNYADLGACTLLIDIGARTTDLIFLEEGRVFIRSLPVAGNAITQQLMREFEVDFEEAEQLKREHAFVGFGGAYEQPESEMVERISKAVRGVMTRMHAEINRSINFYRGQQGGSKPQQVLLTGGTSVIPYTEAFFRDKLKVDIGYFNPFENVPVSDGIDTEEVARNVYVLGQVVGLALRRVLTCPIEISLMPAKVLEEQARRKRQPMFVLAGFGVVLILLVWIGFYFKMGAMAGERFELVDRQVQALTRTKRSLEGVERKVSALESDLDTLMDLQPERTAWLEVIDEIREALPEGIWITTFRPLGLDASAPGAGSMAMMGDPFGMMGIPGMGGDMDTSDDAGSGKEEVEISGLAYVDVVRTNDPIIQFRDALMASHAFADETDIISSPNPLQGAVTRSFIIRLVLAERSEEL